ncbi:glycoside hydrolase [Pterulicium gracile]|uniref:Glycoside hydrolase n=1 Tax=Pterulicium gracile TaxID=1884261 RepID=A0A5C3Q219_9AGAR|nr:glycoside hydrolase [Pterula gracilis]
MPALTDQLKREIGQHFVFGFHGYEPSEDIKVLIRDYFVGSVILFKRNIRDPAQVHRLIHELQALAKESGHARPLMIGIDQENGLVSAFSSPSVGTQFPGAMALASAGSPELAEQVTAATAKELKAVGINWTYSPDADVNSEPKNPVIGVRSFGDNPLEITPYVRAVQLGLEENLIAASAKHFPGHGDTHVDSHLSLPLILKDKAALTRVELVPFRALITGQIATIMTGHMALPNITGSNTPCSLSRMISHDLLRGELGFKGVVRWRRYMGAVMSLLAGADIAMVCHTMERQRGAVELAYKAVEAGELELEESGRRVKVLKETYAGSWDAVLNTPFDTAAFAAFAALKKDHAVLSEDVYNRSVALIQDPNRYLPLSGIGSVVLLTPINQSVNAAVDQDADEVLTTKEGQIRNTAGAHFASFARCIARRTTEMQHVVYSPTDSEPPSSAVLDAADSIIFITRNADRAPWQIEYLKRILGKGKGKKVVVLASCAPYDLLGASGDGVEDVAYVASFEYTVEGLEAAARVLFGEVEARGVVPVLGGRVGPAA